MHTLLSRHVELLEDRSLLAAGALDPTFGVGGIIITNIVDDEANIAINDLAVQADGKVVVVGAIQENFTDTLNTDVLVARYTADGVLDTTFGGDGIVQIAVGPGFESGRAISILPSGKILIAGDVGAAKNDSNTDLLLIRLNADGSLDTSFDGDGIVTTHVAADNNAQDMAVLPDGRIIIAGSVSYLQFLAVRYNADGSLDTSFDVDGSVVTSFTSLGYSEAEAYSLAVQSDGKLILAGRANLVRMAVARYNTDGSLDTTFDGDGLAAVATSTSEGYATTVALAPDGRIVLGGLSSIGSPRVQLIRLLANGSLDTSFDGDGKVVPASPVEANFPTNVRGFTQGVAVQPDGKVVFSALFSFSSFWLPDNFVGDDATAVGRLNVDGTLDSTFSADGWATQLPDDDFNHGVMRPIVLQPDGKIVAGGASFAGGIGLARLNSDGLLDTTFAGDGRVGTSHSGTRLFVPTNERANGVAIQSDGRVVVAGTTDAFTALGTIGYAGSPGDRTNGFVVRYDASGALDTSWDGLGTTAAYSLEADGRVVLGSDDHDDFHDVISLSSRDVVTAAGFDDQGLFSNERFFPDGQADQIDYLTAGNSVTAANALVSQSDGKIVSVGSRRSYNSPYPNDSIVARSLGLSGGAYDGQGDATFGTLGVVAVSLSSGLEAFEAVAVQTDGKIVAAGWAESGANKQFVVVRLNSNGTLDTSFSGDGITTLSFGGTDERAQAVVIQADGKIVVGGYTATGSSSSFVLARLLSDGTLDNSFDGDGRVTTSFSGVAAFARGLVLQSNGKLVLGGDAGNAFALARYNTNGSLDSTFDGDGRVTTVMAASTIAHHGADLVMRADGSFLLAGGVTYFDGRTDIAVARYLGDATVQAPTITHISEDRGRHDRDAITNDQTLMIFGRAVPNRTIEIFRNSVSLGTTTSDAAGQWSFDSSATVLGEGQYNFAARVIGASVSSLSESFLVTIDLTAPAPANPQVSDSGTYSTDRVTSSVSRFDGYAEPDSSVELWLDSVQQPVGNSYNDLNAVAYRTYLNSYWRFSRDASVPLSLGTHQVTTRVTDLAGNSTFSNPLSFLYVSSGTAQVSLSSVDTVLEGSATAPFTIALSTASDQQINVGLTWSGSATAGADFTTISPRSVLPGVIADPLNVLLDDTVYEGDETLTVDITSVSFGGVEQGVQTATVTIVENDAPTVSDIGDLSTPVGVMTSAIPFVLGNFATGINVPVTATSSNTLLVPNGNIVFGGSGADRTVTIMPVAGCSGQTTISVTAGHGTAIVTDTFVLTVGVEANRPTITAIADQVTLEDVPLAPLDFTVGDDDTAVGNLSITASSSNTAIVPNGNIVLGGSGASRTIAVTPAANTFGTTSITITITDDSGMSATESFDLQVDPVNDAPTISDIADQSTDEDSPTNALAFTVGDLESATASLVVTAVSSNTALVPNSNIAFSGSGANRSLVVTPALNQFGTATITVTVNDGATTMSDSFVLTVNAVNDAPSVSDINNQTTNEDTATSSISFTVGDVESAAGSLTVTATSSDTTLVPNGNIVLGGSGTNRTVTITPAANQSGSATITVTVSDGSQTASDTFLLAVNAINDAPTISDVADQTTDEDVTISAIPFTIGDIDTVAGGLAVTAASSNTSLIPNANLSLGGSGANRTLTILPVANQSGSATITLSVSDGVTTATDTFLVTVSSVNDRPTISDITNRTIDEDTSTSAIPFLVSDLETATGSVTVTATSSNVSLVPDANIVLGGSGANRSLTITPVANQFGTTTITVTVNDGVLTSVDTFVVTVNAVNDVPTISAIGAQTIDEDTPAASIAFTIGDVETASGSLTVTATSANGTLVPNSNLTLGGSGANRTLVITPALNQFGTTNITVTVSDGTTSASSVFLLAVTAVADAPTLSDLGDATTNEDTPTPAINFTITDPDLVVGSLIVTVTSSETTLVPNANLTLGGSGADRTLTVTPAANQFGSTTITVSVSNGTLTTSDTFVLTVAAINDAPTITDLANVSILEDGATSPLGFQVGDVESLAADLTVTVTSSNTNLIPNDHISLGGSGANRSLTLIPASNLFGSATITVTVSDGGLSTSDTFVLTVDAVNDLPTISDVVDQVITEDSVLSLLPFTIGDVETAAGALSVTAVSSNTALVSNANIVFGGSGTSRTLSVTPTSNQSGSAQITIRVSDGTATVTDTFELTVTATNDAPTISNILNQTVNEDVATPVISFAIGDLETNAADLMITATSSDQTLLPDSSIALSGSGTNRTIRLTPAANRFGTATITVTVSDGELSAADTLTLTVNSVNDVPTISSIGTQTTLEDTPLPLLEFTIGDLESATENLTVTATTGNAALIPAANLILVGSGSQRTLAVTPTFNAFGFANVTLTVSDGQSSASSVFVVNVTPVNDAPSIGDIAPQTTNEDSAMPAIPFVVADLETPAGNLSVTATSSNELLLPNGNLTVGGSGSVRTLTATPAANRAGITTITVTASDGSLTTSESFELTVNSVNDRPTLTDIAHRTILEDSATPAIPFMIGDLETEPDSLTVTAVSSNVTLVPNANIVLAGSGPNRTLVLTPAANQSGMTTITVQVSDGTVTTSDTFVLTVSAVNDPPILNDIPNQSTNEDAVLLVPLHMSDVETAAGSLKVSAKSSNTTLVPAANIVVSGTGANRSLRITPAANKFGTSTITVQVSDGAASVSNTFLLTVNSLNDPPTISNITNKSTNEDTTTTPISFTIGDIETAAANVTVTATSSDTTLVPNGSVIFSGTGTSRTLRATPARNQFGTATITVAISDGTATTTDTFLLTVNSVNDLPTISDIANRTVRTNTPTTAIPFAVSDVETAADNLIVSGTSSNSALVPNANIVFSGSGTSRTVRITPALNRIGTATITVRVRDGISTVSDTFVLTVSASASALTATPRSASLLAEESSLTLSPTVSATSNRTASAPLTTTISEPRDGGVATNFSVGRVISSRIINTTVPIGAKSAATTQAKNLLTLDTVFESEDWFDRV